jgi:hypothetical membrane protein
MTGGAETKRAATRWTLLAWGAIVGQVIFATAWLVASALEGSGYSSARNDLSDLAALTAHHAPVMLAAQGIAGVVTIAFAIGALRPLLVDVTSREPIGAWLVGGSIIGLDNLSDAFFRLDCRHADPGCTFAAAMTSWHGKIHVIVGAVTWILTMAAPFVLAHEMRRVRSWRDLALPAVAYGIAVAVLSVIYGALHDAEGGGYAQRLVVELASFGIIVLALRVRRMARATADEQVGRT